MRRAAAVLVAAVWAGAALAQQPAQVELPPPVLTIDTDRLFEETALGRSIADEIEQAARALAEENRRIDSELLTEERVLTDQRAAMPLEEFRPLAEAFDEKVQQLRAEQDEKERALLELRDGGRQRFLQEAIPVLWEIVQERGALVLLDRRRDVFLSADGIDITDAAIARIDSVVPPGPTAPEAPATAPAPDAAPDALVPGPAAPEAPPAGDAPTELLPAEPAPAEPAP